MPDDAPQKFVVWPEHRCPSPELESWIPGRVRTLMEALRDGRSVD